MADGSTPAPGLTIRKLRREDGKPRIPGWDPLTGEKTLIDPTTLRPSPYELEGVEPEGEVPDRFTVPMKLLQAWRAEGWVSCEPPEGRVVHRPGGPPEDPWRITHTFLHYDRVTLGFLSDPIAATVTHQPDKYADHSEATYPDQLEAFDADDDTSVTSDIYAAGATRIDWFYTLEREA
jgi:hypothetical protein